MMNNKLLLVAVIDPIALSWSSSLPDDIQQLLSHSKDGQVLPLLQQGLLLSKLTARLAFVLHVIRKFLLGPARTQQRQEQRR